MKNECWDETIDNNYKICFDDVKGFETWIYGVVVNMNAKSIFVEVKEKGLHIIPHSSIRWMLPNGLTRQAKHKIELGNLNKIKECVSSIKAVTGNEPVIAASKAVINALNSEDDKWDEDDEWDF